MSWKQVTLTSLMNQMMETTSSRIQSQIWIRKEARAWQSVTKRDKKFLNIALFWQFRYFESHCPVTQGDALRRMLSIIPVCSFKKNSIDIEVGDGSLLKWTQKSGPKGTQKRVDCLLKGTLQRAQFQMYLLRADKLKSN